MHETFEFGQYRFQHDSWLLLGGSAAPLAPQEAKLLSLLLEKRGEIVTHEVIETAIWPNQEISYSSMARLVHSLRATLAGAREAFIATVPKRGYRLSVPVRVVGQTGISSKLKQAVDTDSTTYSHFLEGQREQGRQGDADLKRAGRHLVAEQDDGEQNQSDHHAHDHKRGDQRGRSACGFFRFSLTSRHQ
jgi:DNA-binding winged helix-turn-helix (wHTH) protein